MSIETLPALFWGGYYIFLAATLGLSTYAINNNIQLALSKLNVFVVFSVFFVGLFGRLDGPKGFKLDHLMFGLSTDTVWSLFFIASFLFMLFWWVRFLSHILRGK